MAGLPWLLVIVINLDGGDQVIAPLRNYQQDHQACVQAMVQATSVNQNPGVSYTCLQPKGKEA